MVDRTHLVLYSGKLALQKRIKELIHGNTSHGLFPSFNGLVSVVLKITETYGCREALRSKQRELGDQQQMDRLPSEVPGYSIKKGASLYFNLLLLQ